MHSKPSDRRKKTGAPGSPAKQNTTLNRDVVHANDNPPAPASRRTSARVVITASLFVIVTFLTQTVHSSLPSHGDVWTDLQLILVGHRLADVGPKTLRYAWPFDDGHLIGLDPLLYAHWPPTGGLLTAYVFRNGGGVFQVRAIMLLFAGLALIAFACLIRKMGLGSAAELIGMLALACAAPFHLLADSLSYFTTDTLGRCCALVCIWSAATASMARLRIAWLAGLFITVVLLFTLSGYETLPSIGLYAALLPLAIGTHTLRKKLTTAGVLCAAYTLGFAAGAWLRFENVAYSAADMNAAKSDLMATIQFRIGPAPATFTQFCLAQLSRLWSYYEWHLVAIAVMAIVSAAFCFRHAAEQSKLLRPLPAILVIGLCDCAWIVLVHNHAFIHTHTIHHLGPAIALAAAYFASVTLWVTRSSRIARLAAVSSLIVAGLLAFLEIGSIVRQPSSNLLLNWDWNGRYRSLQPFTHVIPPGSVVVSGIAQAPTVEYALRAGRVIYLNRPVDSVPRIGRPEYLITLRGSPEYDDAMRRFELVIFNYEYALFHVGASPALNRALLPNSGMLGVSDWQEPMWAFPLYVASAVNTYVKPLEIALSGGAGSHLRLWLMWPASSLQSSRKISIDIEKLGESSQKTAGMQIDLDRVIFQTSRRWISYPIGEVSSLDRTLRVSADCGRDDVCAVNPLYTFVSLDEE